MANKILQLLLLAIVALGIPGTADAQIFKKKKVETEQTEEKLNLKKDKIQPYSKVITKEAITDKGLFNVHVVEDKHLYEIPDTLFNRET